VRHRGSGGKRDRNGKAAINFTKDPNQAGSNALNSVTKGLGNLLKRK
jgi:hypothetical protein